MCLGFRGLDTGILRLGAEEKGWKYRSERPTEAAGDPRRRVCRDGRVLEEPVDRSRAPCRDQQLGGPRWRRQCPPQVVSGSDPTACTGWICRVKHKVSASSQHPCQHLQCRPEQSANCCTGQRQNRGASLRPCLG